MELFFHASMYWVEEFDGQVDTETPGLAVLYWMPGVDSGYRYTCVRSQEEPVGSL